MKMFLIFLLLPYALASPTLSRIGRIVGGEDIPIEKVPYQISLQDDGAHICGGSIIAPNYIVTSVHCTTETSVEHLTVRAGSSILESGGQVVNVKEIHNHPNYVADILDYDISVLELAEDLVFGEAVSTIDLPSPGQTWPAGTEVLVTGWGQIDLLNPVLPLNLQGVTVELIDQETCEKDYIGSGHTVTERMLCAGVDEGGKDACNHDSGGALQVDGVLVGVVSWGSACALKNYPGVYANVPVLLDFIQSVVGL